MANKVSAKSILKQPSTQSKQTLSDEQNAKIERDRRNLGIALHHANKIQARKDVEASILSNIETLLEYPSETSPTSDETTEFITLITPFQPSDFDSLIEERRIAGKCGYTLCLNAPRSISLGASAAWKLKSARGGDYCSNDCTRKALYVRTQLSEVPAWERVPGQQPRILLHGSDQQSVDANNPPLRNNRGDRGANDRELALERGEQTGSFRPNQVMADSIVEKAPDSHRSPIPLPDSGAAHNSIEGYIPMQTAKAKPAESHGRDPRVENRLSSRSQDASKAENEEEESWNALYDNLSNR